MILPSFLNPTSPSWLSTSLYSIAETDMRISRCKRRLGAWQLLGKNDSVETVGRKEDEGRGPGRKAGICLTFFTGWEIVCKGIWRLAAGAMGCYRRLAIQNNSNQRVERRETFKNARGTPERFCFTLKHINAPLFAFCHKMHIFLSFHRSLQIGNASPLVWTSFRHQCPASNPFKQEENVETTWSSLSGGPISIFTTVLQPLALFLHTSEHHF